jgi:NAD(P)-dependent dehydrogenase (short-subunit alcohol dehydrogenase family)
MNSNDNDEQIFNFVKKIMKAINGKIALITGGSKGIGYGIAESLLREGVHVAITSRKQASADEAAKQLQDVNEDAQAVGYEADVRSLHDQQEVVNHIIDRFGQLDYVIANAGLGKFGSIEELSEEDWKQVIETNLNGVFFSIKSASEALKKSKGYFISISSLAGANFFAKGGAYNASKFGVTGFTQAAMLDMRPHEVSVSTIMPGSVTSHFNDHTPSEEDAWKIQPEDLGELIVDLFKMNKRSLPSKIEIRPSLPPSAKK